MRFEGSRCTEYSEEDYGSCAGTDRSSYTFPAFEYCHYDYDSSPSSQDDNTGGSDICGDRSIVGNTVIGEEATHPLVAGLERVGGGDTAACNPARYFVDKCPTVSRSRISCRKAQMHFALHFHASSRQNRSICIPPCRVNSLLPVCVFLYDRQCLAF